MKSKLVEWYSFYNNSSYRDLAAVTTPVLMGTILGALRSVGEPQAVVLCNTLCGSAYGAYAGIPLAFGLHLLDHLLKNQHYQSIDQEQNSFFIMTQ